MPEPDYQFDADRGHDSPDRRAGNDGRRMQGLASWDEGIEDVLKKYGGWDAIVLNEAEPSPALVADMEAVAFQREELIDALAFARLPERTRSIRMAATNICNLWKMVADVNKSRVGSPVDSLDWRDELSEALEIWREKGLTMADIQQEISSHPERYENCRDIAWTKY